MTVEEKLRATIPGYPFEMVVLKNAVISPIFAKPMPLRAISLDDEIEDYFENPNWVRSLKYALSTLYYSASGVFSGGSRSEQIGDVRTSLSGFIITQADREYWRKLADKLRGEIGCEEEEDVADQGGMFDASYLRNKR